MLHRAGVFLGHPQFSGPALLSTARNPHTHSCGSSHVLVAARSLREQEEGTLHGVLLWRLCFVNVVAAHRCPSCAQGWRARLCSWWGSRLRFPDLAIRGLNSIGVLSYLALVVVSVLFLVSPPPSGSVVCIDLIHFYLRVCGFLLLDIAWTPKRWYINIAKHGFDRTGAWMCPGTWRWLLSRWL